MNQAKTSKIGHLFPYAAMLLNKDIREYSRARTLCSEQLAQHFRVYIGYMGSRITYSTYNADYNGGPTFKLVVVTFDLNVD